MLTDSSTLRELAGRPQAQSHIPAAVTDVGCEREINEDRYAVIDSPQGRAWIVCDGMGGVMGGELAAQLAIDAMRRVLETSDSATPAETIKSAIEEANRVIVLRRQNPAFSSMGTTVIAAMQMLDEIVIAHAGDSRAYVVRGQEIEQLTVDHTYVQDLVDKGAIKPEDALSHPQAHVLTRCLGSEPRLNLTLQQYYLWEAAQPDVLVLCSDGLYSLVSDKEISQVVTSRSPQDACVDLVELAKSRGGFDNITVVILPLEGQLREEASPNRPTIERKQHLLFEDELDLPPVPLWKRLLIITLLMCFGCAGTLLFMFLT
ncbi:serine/threonine-protein phosphatase [bacterium]|nr:serine/threonine-protein phosphatase [bacterium]